MGYAKEMMGSVGRIVAEPTEFRNYTKNNTEFKVKWVGRILCH